MYELTADERSIISELWKEVDEYWWGPQWDKFCVDHEASVGIIESLLPRRLIHRDVHPRTNTMRLRFTFWGFLYLAPEEQRQPIEQATEVIGILKKLFREKPGEKRSVQEVVSESTLPPPEVHRTLTLLQQFGAPISSDLESGGNPTVLASHGILTLRAFSDLLEARRKDHEVTVKNESHLMDPRRRGWNVMAKNLFENYSKPARPAKPRAKDPKDGEIGTLYEKMVIHPEIRKASKKLFSDGHYSSAILEAFKMVNILVKKKSGRADLDGAKLMGPVFTEEAPILKINAMANPSDKDEQAGFKLIFMGSMIGIRNPKAHEIVDQTNPIHALQYLALADLLARRVEESTK